MIDRNKSELNSGFFEIEKIEFGANSITVKLKQHGGKLYASAYISDVIEVRKLFMALRLSYAYKLGIYGLFVFDVCIGFTGSRGFITFNVINPRDVTRDDYLLDEPRLYELDESGGKYCFMVEVSTLDIEKCEEGKENG